MDRDQLERPHAGASHSVDTLARDQADSLLAQVARVSDEPPRKQVPPVAASVLAGGRIHLGRRIGQGGMGVVYEAFDRDLGARLALKTTSFLDGPGIYRLKREYHVLRDVRHPNLVRLYDLCGDDGFWFFTMELVEGEWFDRWVRPEGELDEDRLRAALPQLISAVHAIHAADKVHRDLKPSNVLVTPAGRLVVLDFGLTTDPQQGSHETSSNASGTPAYMAPEQATGLPASSASDLYSIGVMLFEALTGRLPFEGVPGHVKAAKQTQLAPSVRSVCPDAPRDLGELADALLQRAPARRPSSEVLAEQFPLDPRGRTSSSPPSSRPRPPLLGRSAELRALHEAYNETLRGGPVVVLISGESGIGKTALVEAFLADLRSRSDAVVLHGRCYERELVPFKAFDSLVDELTRYLRRIGQEAALMMPRDVSALARLFPVLDRLEMISDSPKKQVENPQELRRHAFGAFFELLARIRDRRPLVLYIDDLHWLDADSAVLLQHLLEGASGRPALGEERWEPCPILFVTSHRSEGASENRLLRDVVRTATSTDRLAVHDLRLGPLEADAVRHLAAQLLDSSVAGLAERIAAEAQGSPFFVRELARRATFTSQPSLTLQDTLRAHVAQLSETARSVLEVVAIAGRPIQERLAVDAASTDHTAIDVLRDEHFVRHTSGSSERMIECYHDRIRESVVAALEPARVRRLHHQLMETLLRQENADPEQLALHCDGAGERARAGQYAMTAADAAHAALAYDRAAELYRMALERTADGATKLALKIKLAQALSDGGRGAEAGDYFMEAALSTSPEQALELRRCAAEQWLVSGDIEKGTAAFRDVLGAVGLRLPASARLALVDLLRFRFKLWARGRAFQDRDESEIPRAELLRIDACKTAWSLSFVSTIAAASFQARHLVYALEAGEPNRIVLGLSMEAVFRSMGGPKNPQLVRELKDEARTLVARLDNPHAEAFVHFADGNSNYLYGNWVAACESLERAEKILVDRCRNVTFELNSTHFFWANALVFRGGWRELGLRLEAWLKDARWRGDRYAQATLLLVRARSVTLALGDAAAAQAELDESMALWRAPEFGVQRFLAFITQLQLDLFERQPERACRRIDEFWPIFSTSLMSRIQVCRVSAYQQIAYVALALAARQPDEPRWTRGALKHAKLLRQEGVLWARAFAEFIEASVSQLEGRRASAVAGLHRAAKTFEHAGMDGYCAATRHKLGDLIGGPEGDALLEKASAFFAEQGVAQPRLLAHMRAPGVSGF